MIADPTAAGAISTRGQQAKSNVLSPRRKGISVAVARLVALGMQAAFDGNDDLADMYFLAAQTACR